MLEQPNEAGEYRCIDGTYSKHIVAFCHCGLHRGYLTDQLARGHNCLMKKCVHLQVLCTEKIATAEMSFHARRNWEALHYEAVFSQAQKHIKYIPEAQVLSVYIRETGVEVVCTAPESADLSQFAENLQNELCQVVYVRLKEYKFYSY